MVFIFIFAPFKYSYKYHSLSSGWSYVHQLSDFVLGLADCGSENQGISPSRTGIENGLWWGFKHFMGLKWISWD